MVTISANLTVWRALQLSETTNEEEESYFVDPGAGPTKYPAPKLVDDKGYVIRTSVLEDGTRPEYIIPVGSADSSWSMVKRVASFRSEGWLSLWKGKGDTTRTNIH